MNEQTNKPRSFTADDLIDVLSDTMRQVTDPKNPLDIEKAKAVALLADKIILTAKTEVAFINATNATAGSGFFNDTRAKQLPKPSK